MTMTSLAGRVVLVTRPAEKAAEWAERLAALGAHPLVLPCLVTVPIRDAGTARRLQDALRDAHWLFLASCRAVEALIPLLEPHGGIPATVRLAAVGPATAEAARAWRAVDVVATGGTALGLARDLLARIRSLEQQDTRRVVVAGAEDGRRDAEQFLSAAGVAVTRVAVYRTIPAPVILPRQDLAAAQVDDILLASPSAVIGLVNCAVPPGSARIITIGPTTTAAARAAGLTVTAEARRPGLDGMLEVMS